MSKGSVKNSGNGKTLPDVSGPQLIGYARVSTPDQSLEMQTRALHEAGCLNIYEEKISGAKKKRAQLELAIKDLRPGDTLVVWRLDRLSRSIRDLHSRLGQIEEAGANLRSLTEHFDFTTAVGKLMLNMLAVMAEFERQLTIERTKAGMAVLRAKGMTLGAPRKFDTAAKKEAKRLLKLRERRSVRGKICWRPVHKKLEIAKKLGIAAGTLHLWIRNGMEI